VNKTAASAAQLAKCIMLRLFTYNRCFQLREHKQKLHVAHLTSWHNNNLGYNLRTD